MGSLIRATCTCGFESEQIMQGFGFMYFETEAFYEPAYCDHCGTIVEMDGRDQVPVCEKCNNKMTYYKNEVDAPAVNELTGMPNTEYLSEREFWHCPRCKKQNLKFIHEGMWD
jgi:ribosomal protein L37AE/L43A